MHYEYIMSVDSKRYINSVLYIFVLILVNKYINKMCIFMYLPLRVLYKKHICFQQFIFGNLIIVERRNLRWKTAIIFVCQPN